MVLRSGACMINEKVSSLSGKLSKSAKNFLAKYPRKCRTGSLSVVSEDLAKYYFKIEGFELYEFDSSVEYEYNRELSVDMQDCFLEFNSLAFYRILKSMYGAPDPVFVAIDEISGEAYKLDWGYLLILSDDLCIDIYSVVGNVRCRASLFTAKEIKFKSVDSKKIVEDFFSDLAGIVRDSSNFFSVSEETERENCTTVIENTFVVRMESGKNLFRLATLLDSRPERKLYKNGEAPEVHTVGSLFAASLMFYIISVECLLNIIYKKYLLPEFAGNHVFERALSHKDFMFRLGSLHLYCSCFSKPVVEVGSDFWSDIDKLREFRNNFVHGNLTRHNELFSIFEDGFAFALSPAIDKMGFKKNDEKFKSVYTTSLAQVDKDFSEKIIDVVHSLVDRIRGSLNLTEDKVHELFGSVVVYLD